MSISLALSSFEWQERKVNLIDTPGDSSFIADALGRTARLRVGGVRRQRGDGRRGPHQPAVAASGRARPGAAGLRQHARPRARRLLPHAGLAEVRVRPARRRHRDPDRLRARGLRRDRPHRHEGLRVRTRPRPPRELHGDPDPRRARRPGPGVPRAADGRGVRDLRRADGALPGGRGDLPRGDRHRAQGRHQPRLAVPGDLRCGHAQPRHQPPARRDRRGPALAGQARRPGGRRGHAGAHRGEGAVRLRVQDPRRPVRRAHQPVPRLPGHDEPRLPGPEHHAPTTRSGSASWSPSRARTALPATRRVRTRRHRRGGQAQGDARRGLAGRARRADHDAVDQAPRAGDGLRDRRGGRQGRRGEGVHRAAPPPGGGPDDRPAPRPPDR